MLNFQKIFNKVKGHLLAQNEKAFTDEEDVDNSLVCAYKTENGLKCAFGCLIPDDLYTTLIENSHIKDVFLQIPELVSLLNYDSTPHELGFLRSLQEIHDDFLPEQWANQFGVLAKRYNIV